MGTFILERFNGKEVYRIDNATLNVSKDEDGIFLFLDVETEEEPIQKSRKKEWGSNPSAEITVCLDEFKFDDSNKIKVRIPAGYDENAEESVATMCYWEHEDINNNEIEIENKGMGKVHVHWTGTTVDVQYSDGNKPDAKIEIDGEFDFEDYEDWI